MQRVLSRSVLIFVVIVFLLVPASAFADDPLIQPPFPHAISPVTHSTFWQIVRIILSNV
jgi:hypothetical protein